MGIADVIPGVSGGTIAFIFGIYQQLINSIRLLDIKFLRLFISGQIVKSFFYVNGTFLSPLFLGIISAIILLSKIALWLLAHHPVLIYAFFFGLILATVPIIFYKIKRNSYVHLILLILSALATFFLVQMSPVTTPDSGWFIFLSGSLAICAMILPGISGAFILLLLGKYEFLLHAIHQRDLWVIFIFSCGMLIGIISFVRLLEFVFKRYHDQTIAILSGFVLGSLNKIWPWKEVVRWLQTPSGKMIPLTESNIVPVVDQQLFVALILMVGGFVVAYLLNHSQPNHR